MALFEVLYGRQCRAPLNWIEPREKVIFGPDLVDEAEAAIHHIQDNLKVAKSGQETYSKKEASTLGVQGWKPRVLEGLANEGHEKVWG
jgi:hypothetical protein